jgi:NADH-quinone oxidoreductase subunit L
LPFHSIEVEGTLKIVEQVVLAPATWITLGVVAVGFAAWIKRDLFKGLSQALEPVLSRGLGFDWINRKVTDLTVGIGTRLQVTQTGQLNWNILGILAGLVVLLLVLVRGK